jgi:hypothetical protein
MKKDVTMHNRKPVNQMTRWCVLPMLMAMSMLISGCGKSEESPKPADTPKPASPAAPAQSSTQVQPDAPAASAAKFHLVEVAKQDINTNAATLKTPDGRVTVSIEPNTFKQSDALVISTIKEQTPGFSPAFKPMAVYDISTQKNNQPAKPVTVTFNSGEKPAQAAWWNEDLEAWLCIPTEYDPQTGITRFTLPHFTLIGWFTETAGYKRQTFGDFEIIWDANALDVPKRVTDAKLLEGKILYGSSGDFAKYLKPGEDPKVYDGLPDMVRDSAVYLNYALRQYKDAGFKTPSGPTTIVIETKATKENARYKVLGVIHIGEYNNGSEQLKQGAAHELFHTIQNQYLWSLGGMTFLSWWCECTAEYAGSITWDYKRPARRPAKKYFSEALTSSANEHDYQTAHFIDKVLGPGTVQERLTRLRKFWVGTLGEHGITDVTDITFPMTTYLKSIGHGGVNEVFREHVADLIFSDTSPMISSTKDADPKMIPAEVIDAWALLKTDEKKCDQLKMNLKGGRRAKVWGVKAQLTKDGRNREVELKVGGPFSGYLHVLVHILPGDQRTAKSYQPTAILTDKAPTTTVTLGPKDTAYVVVINTAGGSQVEMTLDVKDAGAGVWQLLSAEKIKSDPFAPNLKWLGSRASLFNGTGDTYMAWGVPADKMEIPNRVAYEFDVQGKAGELSTITKWKERIYLDSGKVDADMKMTITRQWSPAFPQKLKPGTDFPITETITLTPEPANYYTQSRFKPKLTGLVITSIEGQKLGSTEYTNVESPKWRKAPLQSTATHAWKVPSGKAGDRLHIMLKAADSAPENLGQSSGSYLDQFQFGQLMYVYEYTE